MAGSHSSWQPGSRRWCFKTRAGTMDPCCRLQKYQCRVKEESQMEVRPKLKGWLIVSSDHRSGREGGSQLITSWVRWWWLRVAAALFNTSGQDYLLNIAPSCWKESFWWVLASTIHRTGGGWVQEFKNLAVLFSTEGTLGHSRGAVPKGKALVLPVDLCS